MIYNINHKLILIYDWAKNYIYNDIMIILYNKILVKKFNKRSIKIMENLY